MSTQAQINANRRNAQKSTGPKTDEGKAAVAQNAVKHGLFAQENVIQCEEQEDYDRFREKLSAGLAPVGGVEAMLAERIVSLSWRLKRVERMNSEVIDVKIAKAETDSIDKSRRREAGLLDPENGKSELTLGWAIIDDFKYSKVLERLLMYEKRIESSLYKAMDELKKLQGLRKKEETDGADPCVCPGRPHGIAPMTTTQRGQDILGTRGRDARDTECEKQSQSVEAVQAIPPLGKPATLLLDERDELKKQSQMNRSIDEKPVLEVSDGENPSPVTSPLN